MQIHHISTNYLYYALHFIHILLDYAGKAYNIVDVYQACKLVVAHMYVHMG